LLSKLRNNGGLLSRADTVARSAVLAEASASGEKRLFFYFFLFSGFFLLVILRLYWVQIVKHELWRERAERQHVFVQNVLRKRGSVYDRNGYPLAVTYGVKRMICDPLRMAEPEAALKLLSRITHFSVETHLPEILDARERKRRYYVIKNDVTLEEYEQIRLRIVDEARQMQSFDRAGLLVGTIHFEDAAKRFYPYNTLAANVLGFVGREGAGLEGVERFYDEIMSSKPGVRVYEKGLGGMVVPNSEKLLREPEGGTNIFLSIDIVIQYLVERRLREVYEQHRPKNAIIIVMNPENGEVLAMASQPGFNPNYFSYYSMDDYRNRAIWELYEPGSTLKVFTLAAAVEDSAVTLQEKFMCKGHIDLYDVFRIHCSNRRGHGLLDAFGVMQKSCNVGAIMIGQRLGTRRLYHYLRSFGFGEKTGIQLPGETSGLLRPPQSWSGLSLPALSIGQEIGISAIQMATAFSAVVNGGILYKPQILYKTRDKDSRDSLISPFPVRRVISEQTSSLIRDMMLTVTKSGGTGSKAAIPGYLVGGKTGTAQSLADLNRETEDLSGDSVSKVVASFIGAVPAEAPRFVLYVMINAPRGEKYQGGDIAAPVFSDLGQEILTYMKEPPRRSLVLASAEKPAVVGEKVIIDAETIREEVEREAVPDWLSLYFSREEVQGFSLAGVSDEAGESSSVTTSSVDVVDPVRSVRERLAALRDGVFRVQDEKKAGNRSVSPRDVNYFELLLEEESSIWE
jgi:cell division protein FtsI/penicillin-binding protein 2